MGSKVTVTSGSGEDMSVRLKATSIDPNFPSAFGKAKNKYMKGQGTRQHPYSEGGTPGAKVEGQ